MKRRLKGRVISKSGTNTVSVMIDKSKVHPLYKKRYVNSKKFLAHDESGVVVGDLVTIEETKPISKKKKWIVIKNPTKGESK